MLRDPRLRVLLVACAIVLGSLAIVWTVSLSGVRGLSTFSSYEELARFLDGRASDPFLRGEFGTGGLLTGPGGAPASDAPEYTGTNVQVEGVDELDTVKTDGTYLYLATGSEVVVARAHPADQMSVVARINTSAIAAGANASGDPRVEGLFVDGTRLGVVVSVVEGGWVVWTQDGRLLGDPPRSMTYVGVYDLTAVDAPILATAYAVSGYLVAARMIAPYVYVVANEYVVKVDDVYLLPETCDADACEALPPTSIRYDPESLNPGSFTNVLAANLRADESNVLSVVTGYTSTLYMSHAALFLTYFKWAQTNVIFLAPQSSETWTTIHKIRIEGAAMEAVASGEVAGSLLNQFSLDEYAGFLRVATTSLESGSEGFVQTNNVYVLDEGMRTVGSLVGLAPRESIYAARFLGDRAYLVTFEKIDPLFVIDLSVPTDPRVLGYLEMPGYSDYLHPFDATRLLGVGKDATPDATGNFSWYQGVKLSLFDVGDVARPAELDRFGIGDRGTDSEALRDHKAFLFARPSGVLVLPVSLAIIDPADYGGDVPPWAYGEIVWIGAYTLRVSVESGFELVGRVTHVEGPIDPYAGWDTTRQIRRSLVIGDVLYTVSASIVKANALADLAEIGTLAYGA